MNGVTWGVDSHVGHVRRTNQDRALALGPEELSCKLDGLFVVADGMGGHAGGETASRIVVETLPVALQAELAAQMGKPDAVRCSEALRQALHAANDAVCKAAADDHTVRGMGTTCVAAVIVDSVAVLANVGDSRIYLLRDAALEQITEDHSLVQEYVRAGEMRPSEAMSSRYKNVITRAVGIASTVEPDIERVDLLEGDTLLLCSDGLTNMLSRSDIARTLGRASTAQDAAAQLVGAANAAGGTDNISAVVVRYGAYEPSDIQLAEEPDPEPTVRRSPTPLPSRRPILAMVLAALLVVVGGLLAYVVVGNYRFTSKAPFLRRIPPRVIYMPVLPQKPPDSRDFVYANPVMLTSVKVRSAPLVADHQSGLYAVRSDGKAVRVSATTGAVTVLPTGIQAPAGAESAAWCTDPQGYLYAVSAAQKAILKYSPAGTRVAVLGAGRLPTPSAVAVGKDYDVFVVTAGHIGVMRAKLAPQTAPLSEAPRGPG